MPRRRRKVRLTTRLTTLGKGRKVRIRIPQSPFRPLKILTRRGVVRKQDLRPDVPWHVVHRRGYRQITVGEDPKEARAVSKAKVVGTLPERIVYKYLVSILRFSPTADFSFQSSLSGGRVELGGIVADFLFPVMKIILRVQGPTHTGFLRRRKDEEQASILVDMGFRVFDLDLKIIDSEYELDRVMGRIFGLSRAGAFGSYLAVGAS